MSYIHVVLTVLFSHSSSFIECCASSFKMPELKEKYAPYFELLVDEKLNKKFVKCKLCDDGTKLSYHGNTSSMKAHIESNHRAKSYKKVSLFSFKT